MKTRIKKIASRGVPWRGSVDEFDLHLDAIVAQESEDAVVDLWLEDPRSFMEGLAPVGESTNSTAVRRVKTGGNGLRRYDPQRAKIASSSTWGDEFSNAKAHADQVLKQLGMPK